jgi:hypothetical protein
MKFIHLGACTVSDYLPAFYDRNNVLLNQQSWYKYVTHLRFVVSVKKSLKLLALCMYFRAIWPYTLC